MKQEISKWLDEIKKVSGKPDESILAINFGLFETENGYCTYLIGSKKYDENDDDWACYEDYIPKPRYLDLNATYKGIGWEKVQSNFGNEIKEYLRSDEYESSILKGVKYITTGFDDGTLDRLK